MKNVKISDIEKQLGGTRWKGVYGYSASVQCC